MLSSEVRPPDVRASSAVAAPGGNIPPGTPYSPVYIPPPALGGGDGSGGLVKQVEVDVGLIPMADASFLLSDPDVTATSKIINAMAGDTPTGKDADEVGMDSFALTVTPSVGHVTVYIRGLEGYIHGAFKINYEIGGD